MGKFSFLVPIYWILQEFWVQAVLIAQALDGSLSIQDCPFLDLEDWISSYIWSLSYWYVLVHLVILAPQLANTEEGCGWMMNEDDLAAFKEIRAEIFP
jgi:hypothetical protein